MRQSYRLLPSCYGAMISTDDMLDLINSARRQIAEPLADVPTDLMTAEELASVPELANSGVTAHKLLNWTRRRTKKKGNSAPFGTPSTTPWKSATGTTKNAA